MTKEEVLSYLEFRRKQKYFTENGTFLTEWDIFDRYVSQFDKPKAAPTKFEDMGDSGTVREELLEGVPELFLAFNAAAMCVRDQDFTIQEAYDIYIKRFEH